MIDFYAMGSPNVVKIYIALEEPMAGRQALHAFPMGAILYLAEKTAQLVALDPRIFPAGQGKYGKKSHRNRSRYQKRPNSSDT